MRDLLPVRVRAAAAIAAVVFVQLVLLAVGVAVAGILLLTWGNLIGLALLGAGVLVGCVGAVCLWISLAVFLGKPSQLFELQILLGISGFFGGLTSIIMLALGLSMMWRIPWRFLRDDLEPLKVAMLLFVWLNATSLAIALLLLRKQGPHYAQWWQQRNARIAEDE